MRDGDLVGVAAPSEYRASQALKALKAEWQPGSAQPSSRELFTVLKPPNGGRGASHGTEPSSAGRQRLEQTYQIAYIAAAPLEPRADRRRVGRRQAHGLDGYSRPFGVRSELARGLGVAEANVQVIVPDTGAGYGGKHTGRRQSKPR